METFPIDLAGILALAGFSELLDVPVPETATQLVELSSDTVLHLGERETGELLAWLGFLVTDSVATGDRIVEIQVELDLPDGSTLTASRNVRREWDALHDWLTRNV